MPSISRLITRLTGLVQRAPRQPQKSGPQVTSLTNSTTRGADPVWYSAREPSGIWQAAESERASAYYADNNENPIWDEDYFLRCRDSYLIKLGQAEQALQEIATAQNRSVLDRADHPAYQGLHWVVQHVLTHDPIHLDDFINAHSRAQEPIDRHADDQLSGRLAWAAIHQLDRAISDHNNNQSTPPSI